MPVREIVDFVHDITLWIDEWVITFSGMNVTQEED